MASYYSFPILPVSDLVAWLANLPEPQPPVTSVDLNAPTATMMSTVYSQFVEMLTGTIPSAGPNALEIMDENQYPQLHEQSFVQFGMLKELFKLMESVGVRDFSWRDVFYPEKKRTIRNISAIINFAKFRQDHLGTYQELMDDTERLETQKDRLKNELDALLTQRDALRQQKEADAPKLKQCDLEIDELAEKMQKLHKECNDLKAESREEKQKIEKCKDDNESNKFQNLNIRNDIEKISSQIVRSPKRVKEKTSFLLDSVESQKKELDSLTKKLRFLEDRCSVSDKSLRRTNKRISEIHTLDELLNQVKKAAKELKDIASAIASNEEAISETIREERFVREQMSKATEKMFNLQKSFEMKRCEADAALKEAEAEKEAKLEKVEQQLKQCEANRAETEEKRREATVIMNNHTKALEMLRAKFDALVVQVHDYHTRMQTMMVDAIPVLTNLTNVSK